MAPVLIAAAARMFLRFFLPTFLLVGMASANSYPFIPLEQAPAADLVTAFANVSAPAPLEGEKFSGHAMLRDDLLRFLREGRLDLDVGHWPYDYTGALDCRGVFFTRDGRGFVWILLSPSSLEICSPEHATCLLVLPGKPPVYPRKKAGLDSPPQVSPPQAAQVVGFCNGLGGGTGRQIELKRRDVLPFLARGKPVAQARWFALEQNRTVTLRRWMVAPIPADMLKESEHGKFPLSSGPLVIHGMLSVASGAVFYWDLWGDDLLHLQSPEGGECLLRLP